MFCQTCQKEVSAVKDLWGNERCPTCKGLAQAAPVDDDKKASGDSIAPNYQKFVDTTNKFNSRKKQKK